ncbi:Protein of unknown function [Cotesia congregata]|uniref:Reverse transcriptase domain-containing protein n=1 Tax=Cotesia congregata TaxID=51543 RepID=A0A8J2MZI2_COTCN|nr:Protein of unknown function [Cotesia congregata]
MLLYADYIALLARNAADFKNELRLLEKYCSDNGLVVNVRKSKVMACHTSCRIRKYCGNELEVLKSYVYLGVPFSSNLRGDLAASEFLKKERRAACTVLSILANLKASSWLVKKKDYTT